MIGRLLVTYPKARSWVARTVHAHRGHRGHGGHRGGRGQRGQRGCRGAWAGRAVPVVEFASDDLHAWFPHAMLRRTHVVVVERVPRPPLERWNLHAADDFALFSAAGLALDDTIFVRSDHECDASLLFHEMVHVVQWWVLQQRGFLILYGVLLLEDGYDEHPLETMAYELQDRYEIGIPFDAGPIIARRVQDLVAAFERRSKLHRAVSMLLPRLLSM